MFLLLVGNERQQCHVAGAFKSFGDHSLVLWARASTRVVEYFCVRRHKAAQGLRVLVVDRAEFVRAEVALFLGYLLFRVVRWAHE